MDERQEETHASHRLITNAPSRPDQYGEYNYDCRHFQTKGLLRGVHEMRSELQFADRAQMVQFCVNSSPENAK